MRNLLVFLFVLVVLSGIGFLMKGSKEIIPGDKPVNGQTAQFKSFQKIPQEFKSKPGAETPESLPVRETIYNSSNTIKLHHSDQALRKYLTSSLGKFAFSDEIWAIDKPFFKGKKKEVIGEFQGMNILKTEKLLEKAYPVVLNKTDNRIGIYLGDIVVSHKKDDLFESNLRSLIGKKNNLRFNFDMYIITLRGIRESLELQEKLSRHLGNVPVDLDIQYDRIIPK
jgi:hypothetical protein